MRDEAPTRSLSLRSRRKGPARRINRLFFSLAAGILAAGCAGAGHDCLGKKWGTEELESFPDGGPEFAASKRAAIRMAETHDRVIDRLALDGREHDWAGVYIREIPDETPKAAPTIERILLASSGEFYASVSRIGCFLFFQNAVGRAAVDGYALTFRPEDGMEMFQPIEGRPPPLEYRLIRWGKRRYLVVSEELDSFRRAVRDGEEPRSTREGKFLLRCCDERLPVPTTLE